MSFVLSYCSSDYFCFVCLFVCLLYTFPVGLEAIGLREEIGYGDLGFRVPPAMPFEACFCIYIKGSKEV